MSEIVNPILSYSHFSFNTPERIAAVQFREPEAKYVADLCLKSRDGGWAQYPYSVFYIAEPRQGYSNRYFGLIYSGEEVFIVNADCVAYDTPHKTLWAGLRLPDGAVIFSQWRHDFKERDRAFVDGGQDYFKLGGDLEGCEKIMLGLVKGRWVVNPHIEGK
jgi:hypothetical protein